MRLTASLLDLNHGRTFESGTGKAARIDRLADSLTVRVLRGWELFGQSLPYHLVGISRSSPQRRSSGRQLYRTNRVLAARDAPLNAIAWIPLCPLPTVACAACGA